MEAIFLSAPAKASEALQARMTTIVVTPRQRAEDGTGFTSEVALKTNPAAWLGRRPAESPGERER
jgi:hypothetical protein